MAKKPKSGSAHDLNALEDRAFRVCQKFLRDEGLDSVSMTVTFTQELDGGRYQSQYFSTIAGSILADMQARRVDASEVSSISDAPDGRVDGDATGDASAGAEGDTDATEE
jgi:hypothetical protein